MRPATNRSRAGKKLEREAGETRIPDQAALEKLGLDSLDDLDSMPDAKGGDALRSSTKPRPNAWSGNWPRPPQRGRWPRGNSGTRCGANHRGRAGGHEFIARDVVETFVSNRLTWEGDDLLFKTDDGKLVPVKDGGPGSQNAARAAQTHRRGRRWGSAVERWRRGDGKTITRAQYAAMSVEDRAAQKWSDVVITD